MASLWQPPLAVRAENAGRDPVARSAQLLTLKRLPEALALINADIEKGDKRWQAYLQRATIYRAQNRTEEALRDLDRVIKMEPRCTAALVLHADIDSKIMEDDRALEYVSRAISVDGKDSGFLVMRAGIYSDFGNYAAAAADLEAYIKSHPERATADICRNMGQLYYKNNNAPKAIEFLSKALVLHPQINKVHQYRADAYFELKNYKAAAADYTVALTHVQAPDFYKKRAECYDHLGQPLLAARDRATLKTINQDAFVQAPFRTKEPRGK